MLVSQILAAERAHVHIRTFCAGATRRGEINTCCGVVWRRDRRARPRTICRHRTWAPVFMVSASPVICAALYVADDERMTESLHREFVYVCASVREVCARLRDCRGLCMVFVRSCVVLSTECGAWRRGLPRLGYGSRHVSRQPARGAARAIRAGATR